jgi:hypothetical protein
VDIMSCHWDIPYPHPRMSPFLHHRARANEQPLHIMTLILEKHWIWLWGLVWLSAIVVAIITQTVYGFTPSGGICYYPQSAGLYGELMQFIPRCVSLLFLQRIRLISRAVVFICITLLYARLYVFLKRPDKIRSPYSNSPTGQSYDSSYKKKATGFLRKLSGEKESPADQSPAGDGGGHGEGVGVVDFAKPTPDLNPNPVEFNRNNRPVFNSGLSATKFPETTYRPPSAPVSPTSEIPPWERIELPVFQVDGQRYGGPSASTKTEMFGGWKGMNSKKRPSTANSTGSNPQTPVPMPFPRGSISHTHGQNSTRGSDGTETTRSRQPSSDTTLVNDRHTSEKERTRKTSMMTTASNTSSTNYNNLSSGQGQSNYVNSRRPSAAPPLASPVWEIDNEDFSRSRSDRGADEEDQRSREEEEEDEEEESDGEMDLMRMLAQDSEPVDNHRRGSREEYELVPESMASYLNRKTALLMLWFPLGVSHFLSSTPIHFSRSLMTVRNVILSIPNPGDLRFRRSTTNSLTCNVEVVCFRPGCIRCSDLRISRVAVSLFPRSTRISSDEKHQKSSPPPTP